MTRRVKSNWLVNACLPSPLLQSIVDREERWQLKYLVISPCLSSYWHPRQSILRQGYRYHITGLHHQLANIVSLRTFSDICPSQCPDITDAQTTETSEEESLLHGFILARSSHQQSDFLDAEIAASALSLTNQLFLFFLQ